MTRSPQPNPLRVLWSIHRSLRAVRPPRPSGSGAIDHAALEPILAVITESGIRAVDPAHVQAFIEDTTGVEPDRLGQDGALAFWINLYNAAAIGLAAEASRTGTASVLRVPGGFSRTVITVSGEELSLDAIEHAKIRRFGDPRVHSALVCGAMSCPTLRAQPYDGERLSLQLDDQMQRFLRDGGAIADRASGVLHLSRIFRWFGGDFTRPRAMPTMLPARTRSVVAALTPWLEPEVAEWVAAARPRVEFLPYDWGLGCRVA